MIFPLRVAEEQGHIQKFETPYCEQLPNDPSKYLVEVRGLLRNPPVPDADVYVFQMPLDDGIVHVVRHLRNLGKVCVGEADDSDFSLPEFNPAFKGTSREADPARNRDHRRRIFQACDAITVSTPFLAEEWEPYKPHRVHVLRNYLLSLMWRDVKPQYEVERPGGRVRVGWMGRLHWRRGDVEILKEIVPALLERNPHVDFVAGGDPDVHDFLGVPADRRVSYTPINFPLGLADITASMDVGLVPLAPIPFNDAKSNLKGMEYAACGIPCVASPSQAYREFVRPGVNGHLAATPQEWGEHLDRLVNDHAARREMGRCARALVLDEYTIEKHAHEWADLYRQLVDLKQRQMRKTMRVAA